MPRIGVLSLQGAFIEHINRLKQVGAGTVEVRQSRDLDGLDGLIIPGGESTTMGRLMDWYDMNSPMTEMARNGTPIWGTCAGMILLARDVDEHGRAQHQPLLKLMDITVQRNAFGSQLDNFEADLEMPTITPDPVPAVFIRAPIVARSGDDVEVLGTLTDGKIVAVRQGNLVATAFHPELTGDKRLHEWFVTLVQSSAGQSAGA